MSDVWRTGRDRATRMGATGGGTRRISCIRSHVSVSPRGRRTMSASASSIFHGYRALGLVSDHVPAIIMYRQKQDEMRIITSVGKSFNSYGSRLQLVEASHQMPDDITCMDSDSIFVFTAAGKHIYAWKHGHKWLVHTYSGHGHKIIGLLAFGQHVVSVDENSILFMHEIKSEHVSLRLPFDEKSFHVTCFMHPSTYTNKFLFGSKQGKLQLINLKTKSVIYKYTGWGSAVTVMQQSPALDIVGIGLENGLIVIHDLKKDETVMQLQQEWGSVVALSFRTDGPAFLASTSFVGHVAIWDLERQRIAHQMRDVHSAAITGCSFVNSQPLLVTNSSDNSLKTWLFNEFDANARQLHVREGHCAPPTCIRFYDQKGHHVLSSGPDGTLKSFSTLSQRLDRNFGSATFNRKLAKKVGSRKDPNKMPAIVKFAVESTREKEWDNVVALHDGSALATTWTSERGCMGQHKLLPQRLKSASKDVHATSVCLSACGHFTLIGYTDGHVDRFNVQSGMHRLSYGTPQAHDGPVTGLATDSLNQMLVSAGADRLLKFWKFANAVLLSQIQMESSVKSLACNRESALLAVALSNFRVKVVDMDARNVIRAFPSHFSEITDMDVSADARWLLVASMDKCVRVWDLPKGKLVDVFSFPTACRSISVSPNAEFLATSHFGDRAIYLWSNICLYTAVSLKPIDAGSAARLLHFPRVRSDCRPEEEDPAEEEPDDDGRAPDREAEADRGNRMEVDEFLSAEQISESLVTLSLQPSSRWKNLLNLDLIKKRNKPKEPPKAAKAAPFFLPTSAGLEPRFAVTPEAERDAANSNRAKDRLLGLTEFGEVLLECGSRQEFGRIRSLLKEMGPSEIDAELRSLDLSCTGQQEDEGENCLNDGSRERPLLLLYFLMAVEQGIAAKKDYELLISYLALCLRIHTQVILKHPDLIHVCVRLAATLNTTWSRVDSKFNLSLSILNYLRSLVV